MAPIKKKTPATKKTGKVSAGTTAIKPKGLLKTAAGKTPAKKITKPAKAKPAPQKVAKKKAISPAAKSPQKGKSVPAAKKPTVAEKPAALKKMSARETPSGDRFRELKRMLITKRDAILSEAKQEIAKYVSGENRQLVDTAIDEGDWATVDISEDISLKRLGAQRQLLLDIEECLRKINEGTYGICEECGEEISQKRLNVIPTASLCVDCKEIREKMEALEQEVEM
jgi:DnaK suppressor protein